MRWARRRSRVAKADVHVCTGGGGATERPEGVKEAAGKVEVEGRRVGGDYYRALEGSLSGVDLTDVTVEVVRPGGVGGKRDLLCMITSKIQNNV